MTTKKTNLDGSEKQGTAEEILGIAKNIPLTGSAGTSPTPAPAPTPTPTPTHTAIETPLTLEDIKLEIMESTMRSAVKVRLIEWLATTAQTSTIKKGK